MRISDVTCPTLLFVYPRDGDPRLGAANWIDDVDLDPFGGLIFYGMGVADMESQLPSPLLGAKSYTMYIEKLLIPGGHADNGIGDKRSGEPVQSLRLLLVRVSGDNDSGLAGFDGYSFCR